MCFGHAYQNNITTQVFQFLVVKTKYRFIRGRALQTEAKATHAVVRRAVGHPCHWASLAPPRYIDDESSHSLSLEKGFIG